MRCRAPWGKRLPGEGRENTNSLTSRRAAAVIQVLNQGSIQGAGHSVLRSGTGRQYPQPQVLGCLRA